MQASGLCLEIPIARSSNGLYSTTRPGSIPQEAVSTSLGLGVLNSRRQFLGRKTAEHHRMDRPDTRAGQHRDQRLRDHGHVDDDAIAAADAKILQNGAQRFDLAQQLAICDAALCRGYGAVVENRGLVAPSRHSRAVQSVETCIARRVREPTAVDPALFVENAVRAGGTKRLPLRPRPKILADLSATVHRPRRNGSSWSSSRLGLGRIRAVLKLRAQSRKAMRAHLAFRRRLPGDAWGHWAITSPRLRP